MARPRSLILWGETRLGKTLWARSLGRRSSAIRWRTQTMLILRPPSGKMSQQRFRIQARYVLLTYAQCGDLDPWAVHDVITSFPAECLIARETHADGGTHLHAFVDFGRKVDIRNPRRFDVEGFHPNIQPCGRTPQKMLDYAVKDGDPNPNR